MYSVRSWAAGVPSWLFSSGHRAAALRSGAGRGRYVCSTGPASGWHWHASGGMR